MAQIHAEDEEGVETAVFHVTLGPLTDAPSGPGHNTENARGLAPAKAGGAFRGLPP
jgi:hypothetical protein